MVTRVHHQGCRHDRNHSDRSDYRHNVRYRIAQYLLAVILLAPAAKAETNPVASASSAATGNVTNQAIQFQNTGAPSRQSFSNGHSCNGPTMMFSPFYTGGDTDNVTGETYIKNQNYGAQLSIMVPLDTSLTALCKKLAERRLEKERLDYELVRALKCAELMGEKKFMFRPGTPMAAVCSDVVPIASYQKSITHEASASSLKSASGSDRR